MVDVFSAENKSIVLSPKDGKLYADGQREVGLSEDKKTMYGAGQTFVKLDDSTFKYKECMEVVNGYRQASQGLDMWKDGDKLKELREKYKPQFEALPNCRHPF